MELACAGRQPGPCVRVFCKSGVLFQMSHLKLQTSHCTVHTPHFTLHTSHPAQTLLQSLTQRSLYTEKLLLTASFYRQPVFTEAFTQRNFYIQKLLHRERAVHNRISAPRQKNTILILKHFVKEIWKENHQRQNWENLLTNHHRNLHAASPIRFTMPSCKRQR